MTEKKKQKIDWEKMTSKEMVAVQAGAQYQVGGEPEGEKCPCLTPIPTPDKPCSQD